MSEHLPHHERHEHHEHHEHARSAEHHHPKHEAEAELSQAEQAEKLEAIHKTIEKEAASSKEVAILEEEKQPQSQLGVNQELKRASFDRLIARVRRQLSGPDRMLSKVTHQPVVDTLSRAGEKTIARPSSLLFGGFVALLGSTILLFMAKHYGFRYNLATFFGLFAAGFLIGILYDVLRFAARRGRPSR